MEKFDWKKSIDECLNSTNFCCIGTVDESGTWSNPLYFAWDGNYAFYVISPPDSRHMKNLEKNKNISMAVYSTNQIPGTGVIGVQLEGEGNILTDIEEVKKAYNIYYKRRFPETGKADSRTPEDCAKENAEWRFVKIVPNNLFYFNLDMFGHERQLMPKEFYTK